MRIVGGVWRGRGIAAPKGETTRPTTDRVREALFSMLLSRIARAELETASVLDAFAGSGALGLEALSRGASSATFVERDPRAVAVLRSNIASLGVEGRATVVRADVFSIARTGAIPGAPFSLLLVDPPYRIPGAEVAALLAALSDSGALTDMCIVSWEHAASTEATWPSGFVTETGKRYGDTGIEIARWERGG